MNRSLTGFTLIELLVVIAILAILSVALVLVINPLDLIKQSRDSTRLTDLNAINKALAFFDVTNPDDFTGTSSIVYVSIPDTSEICANLGLPTLPTGWSYHCVASSTLALVDGTGWIPANFQNIAYGSVLSKLPTDPINTTTTGNYYTYVTGGSWELTALLESNRYKMGGSNDAVSQDGGQYPEVYEFGSSLKMTPVNRDPNLVGYWRFDETGASAYDSSGHSNNGTMYSSTTITDLHTSSGCQTGSCGSFDGTDDYIGIPHEQLLNLGVNFTLVAWIKPPSTLTGTAFLSTIDVDNGVRTKGYAFGVNVAATYNRNANSLYLQLGKNIWGWQLWTSPTNSLTGGVWQHVAVKVLNSDTASKTVKFYINGVEKTATVWSGDSESATNWGDNIDANRIGSSYTATSPGYSSSYFNGSIDDVRLYNRALSAAEIKAIYDATR